MPQARLAPRPRGSRPRRARPHPSRDRRRDVALRQVERAAELRPDPGGQRLERAAATARRRAGNPPPRPRPAAGSMRRSRRSRRARPSRSASTSIVASASRASSASSRASSGRKPGVSPASTGNAASRPWQKPWMVWIRSPPPGASSTCANSVRARAICAGSRVSPSACRSCEQLGVRHPHPGREPLVDPLRHLGRARLGEGQAQDRRRVDARAAAGGTPAPTAPASCPSPPTRTARRARAGRTRRACSPFSGGSGATRPSRRSHGRTIRRGASAGRIRHRARYSGSSFAVNGSSPVSHSRRRLDEVAPRRCAVKSAVTIRSPLPAGSTGVCDVAEAPLALSRQRPIFERRRVARHPLEAAALRDRAEQAELEAVARRAPRRRDGGLPVL